MDETKEIVPKEEYEIVKKDLSFDVSTKMREGFDLVEDVVMKLLKDTRIEEVRDEYNKVIGQRTHIHPQLLSWIKEGRLYTQDMWKMGGGELEQESEKIKLELKAKLVMKMIGKDKQKIQEALDEWKENRSFKDGNK